MANEFKHKDPCSTLTQAEYIAACGDGHIFACQATGDIVYASSATVLSKLGKGGAGTVLSMGCSCIPAWTTNAASATVASTVVVVDGTDTSSFVAIFDSATGSLAPKTDAGLAYNAGTGMLTATGLTGPLTGNASGTAATVTGGTQASITTVANVVTVGALDTGSITSGFCSIDTGSSTITTTGLISGGSLDIDHVLINGTTIGHTCDTDLLTLGNATLLAKGTVTVGVCGTGHDVKFFGCEAGAYMFYDQSEELLEIRGAAADAATSTGKLLLSTALTNINANDVIGRIDFKAPLEAGGTDAITNAASILAVAQATFTCAVNNTDLIFYTGLSAAACTTERFRMTANTELGIGGANYGTDGQVLTSGGAGAAVAWEAASAGTDLSVRATRYSGTQTICDNSFTAVTFPTEDFDTNSFHCTSSNTSRVVFVTAGTYMLTGYVVFAANDTGIRGLQFRKCVCCTKTNIDQVQMNNPCAGEQVKMSTATLYEFDAGDIVELMAKQNSTASLAINCGRLTATKVLG
jgi:hypothetical protein